jgi:hypothetical protein
MSEKTVTYLLRFSLSVTFAAVDLACSIILPSVLVPIRENLHPSTWDEEPKD